MMMMRVMMMMITLNNFQLSAEQQVMYASTYPIIVSCMTPDSTLNMMMMMMMMIMMMMSISITTIISISISINGSTSSISKQQKPLALILPVNLILLVVSALGITKVSGT